MRLRAISAILVFWMCSFGYFIPSWTLKKDEEGIKVYVANKEGSDYKQCKSTVSFKSTTNDLCNYLLNPSNFSSHSNRIKKIKVIKKTNSSAVYYMQVDLPWPASDRDGVYQVNLLSKSTEKAELEIIALPDLMEEVEGHVRIRVTNTEYYVKKNEEKIDIEMYVHTDPSGSVPSVIANYYIEDSPFETLVAIRKNLEK